MPRREVLQPSEAETLGGRKLRELALNRTFSALAKQARVDETSIRRWAQETVTPNPEMRDRMKAVFEIEPVWWATKNAPDTYLMDPATEKGTPTP